MTKNVTTIVSKIFKKLGFNVLRSNHPINHFHTNFYLRYNARRLEHLASLRIPVTGRSVLELGAGIGDLSHYYIDRGCTITITDVRLDNLQYLRMRYPQYNVQFLDMEHPSSLEGSPFDIVHCYGLLYHLSNPEKALEFISQNTKQILFLETMVYFDENEEINPFKENPSVPYNSYSGTGCRPTRPWLFKQMQKLFEYVYLPKTQPNHEEFPLDWTDPDERARSILIGLSEGDPRERARAIFICSRERIENDLLTTSLIKKQRYHE